MGRKPKQVIIELAIKTVLDASVQMNVETIRKRVSDKLGKNVSWNTVKKYLITLKNNQVVEEKHSGAMVLYRLR